MIGHHNTISKHQHIQRNVFDFLLGLTEDKPQRVSNISIVDIIDYIKELEECNRLSIGKIRHNESLDILISIVDRLTKGEAPDKLELEKLNHLWMNYNSDLQSCQTSLIHY